LSFTERLNKLQQDKNSVLCVGLDPSISKLPLHFDRSNPIESVGRFCSEIIESTLPHCSAFKPNLAFFEALGPEGLGLLKELRQQIGNRALVIADGKRGDIGNTAAMYASSFFDVFDFDACTVSAYMGKDSVTPFLEYTDKLVFVLVKTSNAGAADFQDLEVNGVSLYRIVAEKLEKWQEDGPGGEVGFVVGATQGDTLKELRIAHPNVHFLVPGIGAQGGSIDLTMEVHTERGKVVVNSSRSIIYASSDEDFASAAGKAAENLAFSLEKK